MRGKTPTTWVKLHLQGQYTYKCVSLALNYYIEFQNIRPKKMFCDSIVQDKIYAIWLDPGALEMFIEEQRRWIVIEKGITRLPYL